MVHVQPLVYPIPHPPLPFHLSAFHQRGQLRCVLNDCVQRREILPIFSVSKRLRNLHLTGINLVTLGYYRSLGNLHCRHYHLAEKRKQEFAAVQSVNSLFLSSLPYFLVLLRVMSTLAALIREIRSLPVSQKVGLTRSSFCHATFYYKDIYIYLRDCVQLL